MTNSALTKINEQRCFGGKQQRYSHQSTVLNCNMQFSVYLPPQAQQQNLPVVYWLSGLTCTDENFSSKAGAQRIAAELGLILVMPDTSPRGDEVADDPDGSYDFGLGAGFYVNATEQPYARHYRMYDYIVDELPQLIEANFPANTKRSVSGHSMGGHGALVIGIRNSARYCSISAFSPICNPVNSPWGKKAFSGYLGDDTASWQQYDATLLLKQSAAKAIPPILVDQGTADEFLAQQLHTGALEEASKQPNLNCEVRYQTGYDHSYYFIASFIEQHLLFHARYLLS